jgi:hypothetical protein
MTLAVETVTFNSKLAQFSISRAICQKSLRNFFYRGWVEYSIDDEQTPERDAHTTRRDGRSQGVAGNARLTGTTAAFLFVLLAAEGLTILRIGPLLKQHIYIGMLLVPPVMLKIATTMYRFVRYYFNDPNYRRKGPPPIVLRMLGPGLIIITVILFATGIALLYVKGSLLSTMYFLHRASFVLWFCAMTVHVIGHIGDTAKLAPRDFLYRTRRKVAGANLRNIALLTSLAFGVILGFWFIGRAPQFIVNFTHGH